jgi:hypothetical protein
MPRYLSRSGMTAFMYHIQFVKYPGRSLYFAMYHPDISGKPGRRAERYGDLICQVKADLQDIPRDQVGFAFNSHFLPRTRARTMNALGLESRMDEETAEIIPFPQRPERL